MKKPGSRRKGSIVLWFVFIVVSITLLFLFALATPALMQFNVRIHNAGQTILANTQIDVGAITDVDTRTELNDTLNTALAATADNVTILGLFYQYGWVFIIMITAFMLFMLARNQVEGDNQVR